MASNDKQSRWGKLFAKYLADNRPELWDELMAEGDEAKDLFITSRVDEALASYREYLEKGSNEAEAVELALSELLGMDETSSEDWEDEDGQQEHVNALFQHLNVEPTTITDEETDEESD
jgi:hypothetical protein